MLTSVHKGFRRALHIDNRSNQPTPIVCDLIAFATERVYMARTGIVVHAAHDGSGFYGNAWRTKPRKSPWYDSPRFETHINLYIGAQTDFPMTNQHTNRRWRAVTPWTTSQIANEYVTKLKAKGVEDRHIHWAARFPSTADQNDKSKYEYKLYRWYEWTIQYGGKKSPIVTLATWQEALVFLAAHEAHHIHQFQNGQRAIESDCENQAYTRLQEFRTTNDPILFEAYRTRASPHPPSVQDAVPNPMKVVLDAPLYTCTWKGAQSGAETPTA